MDKAEAIKKLKETPMFRYFQESAIDSFFEMGDIQEYKADDYVIHENDSDASLFVIVSGAVHVTVTDGNSEVYICTIGEGEVFGEAGIFSQVRRTANVVANRETVVLVLTREALLNFIKENPTPGIQLLLIIIYSLLKKLREVNQDLAYERKGDISQEDIDAIIRSIMESDRCGCCL